MTAFEGLAPIEDRLDIMVDKVDESTVREGVSLHVEVTGIGPAILLMHGFGGSARNFRPQVRALRDTHRVIVFDARGHARSAAPPDAEQYRLPAFLHDVDQVLDQTGAERVVLGGLSMGAAVALHYALGNRQRLAGLVLAGFPPPSDIGGSWATAFADAIDQDGLEQAGAQFVWGGERFDASAQRWIREGFLEHPPHALSAILRQQLAQQPAVHELADELSGLDLPTLVIVGSDDARSLQPSRELARLLPLAQLVEVAGAGHVVNLSKPESFNEALIHFLRNIPTVVN